jgi:hypothetical protein
VRPHRVRDHLSLELAIAERGDVVVDGDRCRRCRGNDLGGLHRTNERTADDLVDTKTAQPARDRKGVRDAFVIDGIVGPALEAALASSP